MDPLQEPKSDYNDLPDEDTFADTCPQCGREPSQWHDCLRCTSSFCTPTCLRNHKCTGLNESDYDNLPDEDVFTDTTCAGCDTPLYEPEACGYCGEFYCRKCFPGHYAFVVDYDGRGAREAWKHCEGAKLFEESSDYDDLPDEDKFADIRQPCSNCGALDDCLQCTRCDAHNCGTCLNSGKAKWVTTGAGQGSYDTLVRCISCDHMSTPYNHLEESSDYDGLPDEDDFADIWPVCTVCGGIQDDWLAGDEHGNDLALGVECACGATYCNPCWWHHESDAFEVEIRDVDYGLMDNTARAKRLSQCPECSPQEVMESSDYDGLPDEDDFADDTMTCTGCDDILHVEYEDWFECQECQRDWCEPCMPFGYKWKKLTTASPAHQSLASRWVIQSDDIDSQGPLVILGCPGCIQGGLVDPATGEFALRFDGKQERVPRSEYQRKRIHNESVGEMIPISELFITKEEILDAVSNLYRGHRSMTEGPLTVNLHEKLGRYQLVNGYHRLVEAMMRGETSVSVKNDGPAEWRVPSEKELFDFDPRADYYGMEEFIEHYMLRNL